MQWTPAQRRGKDGWFGVYDTVAVSGGADLRLAPHWWLTVEVQVQAGAHDPFAMSRTVFDPHPAKLEGWSYSAVIGSVGPSWTAGADGAGVFVTPRLLASRRHTVNALTVDVSGDMLASTGRFDAFDSTDVGLAVDVGYRWRWERFSLALLGGVNLSYAWNWPYVLLGDFTLTNFPGRQGFTAGINMNLVRLGFMF